MTIAGICPKHGFWNGNSCPHCEELTLQDVFNTPKDKLYEFTDYTNFKHPVEVHGKRHWQSLLKQNGLIDDVKGTKENIPPTIDRKFIAHEINNELQEKWLRDKLIKRR